MEKDDINDEKKNKKAVSYVGNSWIVSHSKSHPGHVYYFNTLTGDAVWNLSDAEIEKAAATKIQPGSKPIVCREPIDNPPTLKVLQNTLNKNIRLQQPQNTSTFQQQKLQQQPKEMFGQHPNVKLLQSQQQSGSIYPDIPMNDLSAFDLNALSNQVNAYNIINNPGVYTPDGWPIPRTQQIIITPTIPLVNQAQSNASLNVAYNQLISTEQTNGPRFNKFQNRQRMFQPRHHFGRGGQRNFRKSLSSLDANDLRQQLYLKRRLNNIANTVPMDSDANFASDDVFLSVNNRNDNVTVVRRNVKSTDISSHIADIIEEEFNSKEKHEAVQDSNNTETQIEAITSKLDLTPLKSLAPSNAKSDSCYIVVDLRVLLDEYDFLSAIVDSDDSCHLTIPQHVMSELKDFIACSNNIPARRILYSLSQLIENGCVTVADECTQDYGATITNPILKTCLKLFDENFHVILLAKDNELLNCKKFIKIDILSVDEAKTLLEWNPLNYSSKVKTVSHSTNTPSTHRTLFTRSKTPIVFTSAEKTTLVKTVATEPNKEIDKDKSDVLPPKQTVDAAIQTDIVTVINPGTKADTVDTQKQTISEKRNDTETTKETSTTPAATTESANKRREIKLKRSISHQPASTNAGSNEKRIFRWRRNRNLNISTSNNDKATQDQDQITKDVAQVDSIQSDNVNNNEKQLVHGQDDKNETDANASKSIESRESSIISVDRSSRREYVTIEETSTSGIISNTESNVDVDAEYNSLQESQHDESNEMLPKIVSYDIESEHMEESLKTKCEEWVSRFIQIMEEVLSVVLRKEEMFSNIEFPPPWTLHEATLCIGKYSNVFSVKYVTDKLSCLLFDISDNTGKIYLNITPRQFMKMYSYGVSLLNEIKAITTCEDIEIAEESLQKLLSDIKNPSHVCNDSIIDTHEDPPNMQITNMDSNQKTNYDCTSPRLKQVTQVQDDTPVETGSDKGTKTTFFSTLSLMEIKSPSANIGAAHETSKSPPNTPSKFTISNENRDNIPSNEDKDECDNAVSANIVRNFSKCTAFEEKIKNKYNNNPGMVNDDEYLDYEEDYQYTTGQLQTDEFDMYDESAVLSDPNVTQTLDNSDITDSVVASSPNSVDPSLASINITFKLMMCGFLEEVGKAMKEVKALCDKCYSELRRPQLSVAERNELKSKVENAHSDIVGLCLSLESMLQRDPNAPTDNMRTALTNAGINISQVDRNLILEYWNTVASCKKNVEIFLYSILEIITAFKS